MSITETEDEVQSTAADAGDRGDQYAEHLSSAEQRAELEQWMSRRSRDDAADPPKPEDFGGVVDEQDQSVEALCRYLWATTIPVLGVVAALPAAAKPSPANRKNLRDPDRYRVAYLGNGVWLAVQDEPLAVFVVRKTTEPGVASVTSDTGSVYRVDTRERSCPCPWWQKNGSRCKHLSALLAIARFERERKLSGAGKQAAL